MSLPPLQLDAWQRDVLGAALSPAVIDAVSLSVAFRDGMREFADAVARFDAFVEWLDRTRPEFEVWREHWERHHAPKPHPPVKANRRVHRRRK